MMRWVEGKWHSISYQQSQRNPQTEPQDRMNIRVSKNDNSIASKNDCLVNDLKLKYAAENSMGKEKEGGSKPSIE